MKRKLLHTIEKLLIRNFLSLCFVEAHHMNDLITGVVFMNLSYNFD